MAELLIFLILFGALGLGWIGGYLSGVEDGTAQGYEDAMKDIIPISPSRAKGRGRKSPSRKPRTGHRPS